MIEEPGRFVLMTTCRCGMCKNEVAAAVTAHLERVSISPDADQPGDVVAMAVEFINFPPGWTLDPKDLKPRCPRHGGDDA